MINNDLFKHPLIKLCAIGLVIYFALFANTDNPDSLGNKITKERLKKNFEQAKEKQQFISKNIAAAKKFAKENSSNKTQQKTQDSLSKTPFIICGDQVIVDYALYQSGKILHAEKDTKFIIGSKDNWLIEKNLIGLKKGDTTNINVIETVNNMPAAVNDLLKYKITIHKISRHPSNIQTSCK